MGILVPKRKRLLIVEDNPDTSRKLAYLFRDLADIDAAFNTDDAYHKMKRAHMTLLDALLPSLTNPKPLLENTRIMMEKVILEQIPTVIVACSREYNKELVDMGAKFALDFAGCDGKTDIPGFKQAVHILLMTYQFCDLDNLPEAPPPS